MMVPIERPYLHMSVLKSSYQALNIYQRRKSNDFNQMNTKPDFKNIFVVEGENQKNRIIFILENKFI